MPEYVKKALDRLQHPKPKISQHAPHLWTVPTHEKIPQIAPDPYDNYILDKKPTEKYSLLWEPFYIMLGQLIR